MIELPSFVVPNGAVPALIDFGANIRPSTGAEVQRVDRKGSRYRANITLPRMTEANSQVVIARLLRAKREGLRIPYPLLIEQGSPGSPVVDGAGQTGHTLAIRGLTPSYAIKEGFWLSIVDQNGRHYLHNAGSTAVAGADGKATVTVTPALRWPFANGATIHLAVPMMEGFVEGEAWEWVIPTDRLIALEFPIEEYA